MNAVAAIVSALSVAAGAPSPDPNPLLTFAASQHYMPVPASAAAAQRQKALEQAVFELKRDPPPEQDCAQTLGARRFAFLYENLGVAYTNLNDPGRAAGAYAQAVACMPRAAFLHTELAAALLEQGYYESARTEIQRELRRNRDSFPGHSLLTQIEFIQGRWSAAIDNARQSVTGAPDDEQSTYWQCFLWLAQKRAGVAEPQLMNRRVPPDWPGPILQRLREKITEGELTEVVKAEHDPARQRELLAEALFYAGEQRLAANETAAAMQYFRATVRLDVRYFIEDRLARAELK